MAALRDLARPSGALAMVALDQRESLRTIIAERTGVALDQVTDEDIRRFKVATAEILTPAASAILLDTQFGLGPVLDAGVRASSCALIVAADALTQTRGEAVAETDLDRAVDVPLARKTGAMALKLLVLWRGEVSRRRLEGVVAAFLDRCRAAGVLAVLEGVVRAPAGAASDARDGRDSFDREAEIVASARFLSALGPDLYKVEVPLHGRGPANELRDRCAELDRAIGRPWVVLSQGVSIDDFPSAVEAACSAGASGFLAGRAIWTDSIGAGGLPALRARLEARALPRLRALAELVDRLARPVPAPV